MEKKLQFKVTTLKGSGIWTGSSNHMRMAALQGTSFLGGMRFWTEALLRSFGHRVCDCVDSKKGKEVFDVKAPEKICAACHSFGCTGLARAFRLHVLPVKPTTCEPQEKYIFSIPSRDRTVHYALAKGWEGELALSLSSNRPLSWPLSLWKKGVVSLPPEVVLATFLMLEYGTLGALDQYGCGLVHLTNREDLLPFLREALPESGREKPERGLADLRDFYFFKGAFDPDTLRRLSPGDIRLQNGRPGERPLARFEHIIRLRRLLRESLRSPELRQQEVLRHWICGYMPQARGFSGGAVGSHISVGVTDQNRIYGWGWLPRTRLREYVGTEWTDMRRQALSALQRGLRSVCPYLEWKDFDPLQAGDSGGDWRTHVLSLVESPWREER